MKTIKTYVINLDTEHERRKRITSHLKELGLNFALFKGLRWKDLPSDLHSLFFDASGSPHNPRLTLGEIGCYASHLSLFRQLAQEDRDTAYFILEDDAILDPRTRSILAAIQQTYPLIQFDFLNFRHLKRSCPIRRVPLDGHEGIFLSVPWIPSLSGVAYIITQQGAVNYLSYLKDIRHCEIIHPFDIDFRNAFFEGFLNIWEVVGFVLKRQKLESSIDRESRGRRRIRHSTKREIILKAVQKHGPRHMHMVLPFLYHAYRNKLLYKLTRHRE